MTIKTYFSKRAFCLPAGVVLGALAVVPMAANAQTADFYTGIAGEKVQKTNGSVTSNGLTASSSTGVLTIAHGTSTTATGEIGLGVCTGTTGTLCSNDNAFDTPYDFSGHWSGDGGDELDNGDTMGVAEAITIAGSSNTIMTGTFTLGSLDGNEDGYIVSKDGLAFATFGADGAASAGGLWSGASLAPVGTSGNVFTLTITGFGLDTGNGLADISEVIFRSGCYDGTTVGCGTDNDYLVASAGFSNPDVVPIPAAAWLFGSALLGLTAVARRKQA